MGTTTEASGNTDGSATQRTYFLLRKMIVTGQIGPGEKLKIDRLREDLEIGASPIREALSLLTSDNLVERLDQRGFRTAEVSREGFVEIQMLRCTLEDMALRASIANADETWEEKLVLAHHRMQRAQDEHSSLLEDLHKAFHMALLANAKSPILLKYCAQLYDLNIRYRYLAGSAASYRKRDVGEEHQEIMQAAISGDADTASERLIAHFRRTGDNITRILGDRALF